MKNEKYKIGELVELVKNIFEEPHPHFEAGIIGVVMSESENGKVSVRLGHSTTSARKLTAEELLREGNQQGMMRCTLLLDVDEIKRMATMPNGES